MPTYNKLVRDKIPNIIRSKGATPTTHLADETEYWEKLKEKLQEEVAEFVAGPNFEEELADILEVIEAICAFKGIDPAALEATKAKKVMERGGFTGRIILEQTD